MNFTCLPSRMTHRDILERPNSHRRSNQHRPARCQHEELPLSQDLVEYILLRFSCFSQPREVVRQRYQMAGNLAKFFQGYMRSETVVESICVCLCIKSWLGSQKQRVSERVREALYNKHIPRLDWQREAYFNRIQNPPRFEDVVSPPFHQGCYSQDL